MAPFFDRHLEVVAHAHRELRPAAILVRLAPRSAADRATCAAARRLGVPPPRARRSALRSSAPRPADAAGPRSGAQRRAPLPGRKPLLLASPATFTSSSTGTSWPLIAARSLIASRQSEAIHALDAFEARQRRRHFVGLEVADQLPTRAGQIQLGAFRGAFLHAILAEDRQSRADRLRRRPRRGVSW